MDFENGAVSLHLRPNKEMKTAVVVVSFKMEGDPFTLKSISCSSGVQGTHPDQMALCYSMYMDARERVHRNFSEETKSKISHVHCAQQSGEFMIIAETDASLSTVRKCVAGILHGLDPGRAKSGYRDAVRTLGCSYSEDAFEAAAHEAMNGLKSVDIFVGGKGFGAKNGQKDKIKEALDIAVKKFNPSAPKSKGKDRSIKSNETGPAASDVYFLSKKGDSVAVVCAYLFLMSDVPGICVADSKIVVNVALESRVSKLGDRAELIKKQVEKLLTLENPSHSLAAIAGRYGLVAGSELHKMADKKVTLAAGESVAKMF